MSNVGKVKSQVSSLNVNDLLVENTNQEDSFFICDLGEIVRQYKKWNALLPRVKPYYAVKCNPDDMVLKTLAACGTGFDCASKGEIAQVVASCPGSDVVYANPCKQASSIAYAASQGIDRMTFDNFDEIFKIKLHSPNAQAILRILPDDSKSACRFGIKFGASISIVPELLKLAKDLNVNVIGVSFHVGSGCFDPSGFTDAVKLARHVFDIGLELGFEFSLLDIGGGFPGKVPGGLKFEDIAAVLVPTIDMLFPPYVEVIAEPGRYFVTSAFTLAINIIARRVYSRDDDQSVPSNDQHPSFVYYVNEGIYGAFNNVLFDDAAVVTIRPLLTKDYDTSNLFSSKILGPTCTSMDFMKKEYSLPEMNVGDWLVSQNMGAYTSAAATRFTGVDKARIVYTNTEVLNAVVSI